MPILPFGDHSPTIHPEAFISPQATIVGNVEIEAKSCVWPGAVIRGDQASVRIGQTTCIQDSVVIHAHHEENPVIIGNKTVIGTASVLHGVYVADTVKIGEGCVIFDGATLGEGVMITSGSIIPSNVVIPPRSLNSGAPAAQVRELSRDEVEKQALRAEVMSEVFQKLRHWRNAI
jgi:carbonic anhydrase/acetyltransferase-like protein (isoleucine patch superfamily)